MRGLVIKTCGGGSKGADQWEGSFPSSLRQKSAKEPPWWEVKTLDGEGRKCLRGGSLVCECTCVCVCVIFLFCRVRGGED